MDKLKVGLDAFKRYNFWVLMVVLLLVACGSWFMATAEMAKQFDDRKNALESKFNAVQGAAGKPDLPNDKRIEFIKGQHEILKENVYKAWEMLKKIQEEKNSLPSGLSEEFKRQFKRLGPGRKIDNKYLEEYQLFVLDHFPTLFERNGIRRPADDKAAAAGAEGPARSYAAYGVEGGTNQEIEMVGVVDWNEADLERVQQRFYWEKRPTTQDVVLAQEDLWVYEALLRAIKATNGAATEQYNAPITAIDALEIGSKASESWLTTAQLIMVDTSSTVGTAGSPSSAEAAYAGVGADQGDEPAAGGMHEGSYSSYHGTSSGSDGTQELRYVGLKGKPLGAKASHPYAEFKMMPIRMSLIMDQTMIPKLLVACANSNMPIEIRKVRLYPGKAADLGLTPAAKTDGAAAGGAGSYSSGAMNYGTYGGGYEGPVGGGGYGTSGGGYSSGYGTSGGGYSSGYGTSGGEGVQPGELPLHAPVELQGIIYIFNPPDKDKLGTGTAGEEQPQTPVDSPTGETPPGEAPAGETPAAETPGGETPAAKTPAGETPAAGTPAPSTPAGKAPPAGEPAEDTSENDTPPARAATSDRPAATP